MKKIIPIFMIALLCSSTGLAAPDNADVNIFNPTTDDGKYITIDQSNTLGKWKFNVGSYTTYTYKPLEYVDAAGTPIRGLVDHILMSDIHGSFGITDWFNVGMNFPFAWWQDYTPPAQGATRLPGEDRYAKLGDLRLEMKFKLPHWDKLPVDFAVVPFMYFPTGDSEYYLGNGMWSPGIKLVVDGNINNRVFLAFNIGYRNYNDTTYDINNTDAVIDDSIEMGLGANVKINKSFAVIGEIHSEHVIDGMFQNKVQNPAEVLGAVRFTPQNFAKGLRITAGLGTGIVAGIGAPDFRTFVGVGYRSPKEKRVFVEKEKIVITEMIHFEFDKAIIRPESYSILDEIVMVLNQNMHLTLVQIEGHTDWIGSDEYNQKLSDKRAAAVKNYLVDKGVDAVRLTSVGFGEKKPIADNTTTIGRAKNRRTEFTILEGGR